MGKPPSPTPEGRLIAEAAKRSGQSARQLAAKVGISDTRWRHIVNGYQPVGRGQFIPAVAPPDTLARMARAVGVTAEELVRAGRPDAAAELEKISGPPAGIDKLAEDIKAVLDESGLPEQDRFAIAELLIKEFDQENADIRKRRRDRMRTAVEMWRKARGA